MPPPPTPNLINNPEEHSPTSPPPTSQQHLSDDPQAVWLSPLSHQNLWPRPANSANPRLLTYIDHIQRFSNASEGNQPSEGTSTGDANSNNPGGADGESNSNVSTGLNNINMISDYLYRNLPASTSTTSEEDVNFRSRILHHFSDIHRLQNQVHELMSSNYRRNQSTELPINNIPLQLRNLSRELTQPSSSGNRVTIVDPDTNRVTIVRPGTDVHVTPREGNTGGNPNREAYYVESTDEDDQSFQYNDEADADLFYYSDDNNDDDAMDTSEDDSEEESIPSEEEVAYLRSDIESNERLLLSSARQNPLNINTLIIPSYPISNSSHQPHRLRTANVVRVDGRPMPWLGQSPASGVPLRRQNAIRTAPGRHHYRRYNPMQTPSGSGGAPAATSDTTGDKHLELSTLEENSNSRLKKLLTVEADELCKDIQSISEAIDKIPNFQGESPLFYKNNCEYSKRFRILFFAKLNQTKFDQPGGLPNLIYAMDLYLKKRRARSLFLNIKPTIPPPPKVSRSSRLPIKKKRKSHKYQRSSTKRQKVATSSQDEVEHLLFNSKQLHLSKSEKENILSSLPSSYMQPGSSFSISISEPQSQQSDNLKQANLVFTNITGPELDGVFNFSVEQSEQPQMTRLHCMLLKLHSFIKYFCGFTENSLPRNKILVRKLNVLDRISVDPNIHYTTNLKYSQVNIPFSGHIIDFKKYDLRFIENTIGCRSNRERSNRLRLTLGEWMKISPFIQFKENYFLSFLHELQDNLEHFDEINAKKEQKSQALHLTKQFKGNLYQFTKDFGFINENNNSKSGVTIPFLDEQRSINTLLPKHTNSNKYKDGFAEDWERSLALRLCEVITMDDSTSLLNVQLNYILFKIKVDLSKLLDSYILFIFDHWDVSSKDKVEYINKYKTVYNSILSDENKPNRERDTNNPTEATLIGSIDRKSGQIELQNTIANLFYRVDSGVRYSTNIIMTRHSPVTLTDYGSRNTYVYDDFEVFNSEEDRDLSVPVPVNSRSFNSKSGYVENNEVIATKLVGTGRFVNKGNPVCGMI
ncbi:hypothetical protein JA1_003737 [Spathaspora sp. JA1]|nr:hypothetical protein JA1_003737 [Spathaspora sp. JA1]